MTEDAKKASGLTAEEEDKMKSSGISAVSMVGDAEVIPGEMTSSRISSVSLVDDAEVIPMDVDATEG